MTLHQDLSTQNKTSIEIMHVTFVSSLEPKCDLLLCIYQPDMFFCMINLKRGVYSMPTEVWSPWKISWGGRVENIREWVAA